MELQYYAWETKVSRTELADLIHMDDIRVKGISSLKKDYEVLKLLDNDNFIVEVFEMDGNNIITGLITYRISIKHNQKTDN